MKVLKSLIPQSLKAPMISVIEQYRRTRFYRNRIFELGGRLSGYRIQGGKLTGFDNGTYENDLCKIIEQTVKPNMICVDVGAHVGYITLLFAKLVGNSGKVISFEAHPTNADYVKRNVALNNLSDIVTVENQAISDGSIDRVFLTQGRLRKSAEWRLQQETSVADLGFSVSATSLDKYFASNEHIDFVKMDIEGAEEMALPGMQRIINDIQPYICIEFHNSDAWNTRNILLKAGYKLYDIQSQTWVLPNSSKVSYHCLAVPAKYLEIFQNV